VVLAPGQIDFFDLLDLCIQGLLGEIKCQGCRSEADRVDTAATVKTVKAEILDGEDIVSAAADEGAESGLATFISSRRRS